MKARITLTATKTWTEGYPDNNFSDEVIIDNFWLHTFDQDKFLEKAKLTIKRVL
jgi:hypothetical protein